MKSLMSFMMCTAFLSFSWAQDDKPAPDQLSDKFEKWYVCKKDSDCIKVQAGCGINEAINKKFKKEHDQQIAKAGSEACLEPTPEQIENDKLAAASCAKKTCELVSSK